MNGGRVWRAIRFVCDFGRRNGVVADLRFSAAEEKTPVAVVKRYPDDVDVYMPRSCSPGKKTLLCRGDGARRRQSRKTFTSDGRAYDAYRFETLKTHLPNAG